MKFGAPVVSKFVSLKYVGYDDRSAALAAGISHTQIYYWLKRNEVFKQIYLDAKKSHQIHSHQNLLAQAKKK